MVVVRSLSEGIGLEDTEGNHKISFINGQILNLVIVNRITCSEHVIPYWMNTKWRQLNGPGYGADVEQFLRQLNEKKVRMKRTLLFKQAAEVRQLIRRFPDMDLDYLQEQNPKLGVKYLKENLDKYTERYVINKTYGRRFKHITPSNL